MRRPLLLAAATLLPLSLASPALAAPTCTGSRRSRRSNHQATP